MKRNALVAVVVVFLVLVIGCVGFYACAMTWNTPKRLPRRVSTIDDGGEAGATPRSGPEPEQVP
ncbi:hypothetical protein WAI453_003580 [Rhynchosporium graminicola]